jgi:hypothetical protein
MLALVLPDSSQSVNQYLQYSRIMAAMEPDIDVDADSTFGDNSSTYTESLRSSLLQSVSEHGRGASQ